MNMWVILPIISFLLFLLIFRYAINIANSQFSWRIAFLLAATFWGLVLSLMTELLSFHDLMAYPWLLGAWGGVNFIEVLVYIKFAKKSPLGKISIEVFRLPRLEILLLAGVASIVLLLGVIAMTAPPNNWDSMAYHMSRVAHWIQNRNVEYYPTNIVRQLYSNPWSEYAILHFQILSGGDRFANFIQWFSMIGSLIGVSLIAKQLGANLRRQVLASVIAVTIPMGILQATGTQNDYVASFWLVCFVFFIMRLMKEPSNLIGAVATGMALGLGILTKGTFYLYAFPFLIWYVFSSLRKCGLKALKSFVIIISLAVLINAGHYARNYDLFRHPLGVGGNATKMTFYHNELLTFPVVSSNVIRNIGLHLGTPSRSINKILYRGIESLHQLLNLDMNDPRTTYGSGFFIPFTFYEGNAGNFLHLILALMALLMLLFSKSKKEKRGLAFYGMTVGSSFILLCLSLKWMPWHSRYHLPLFVLSAPFIAQILPANNPLRGKKITWMLAIFMFLVIITGCLLYFYFGHSLVEKMYRGESTGLLNKVIEGQAIHPLDYYVGVAHKKFVILLASLVALMMVFIFAMRVQNLSILMICILVVCSFPWVLRNSTRRMIGEKNIFNTGRMDQYFASYPSFRNPYKGAVEFLKHKGCNDVGLLLGSDDFEYAFWVLFQEQSRQNIRLEHVQVMNCSSVLYKKAAFKEFNPCAIVDARYHEWPVREERIIYQDMGYIKKWEEKPVSVYVRED